MAQTKGNGTKDAMADALLSLLAEGTPLSKIPIRKITEACGFDRQTFYYHFSNINDLVIYACRIQIARFFDVDDADDIVEIDWHERIETILTNVEADPVMRGVLLPALGETVLHACLSEFCHSIAEESIVPTLMELGESAEEAEKDAALLALSLASILAAWTMRDIDVDAHELVTITFQALDSFLCGTRMRLQKAPA